jgi:two-component system, response regulator PdtaR
MLDALIGPRSGPGAPLTAPDTNGVSTGGEAVRILIVEDDYFVAMALEHELEAAGYSVVGVAASASEAIQLAKDSAPNLAIMDIRLAGNSDGIEAAITLLNLYKVPSIFATAHADDATRRRGQAANPRGWVSKPYTSHAVIAAVRAALQS